MCIFASDIISVCQNNISMLLIVSRGYPSRSKEKEMDALRRYAPRREKDAPRRDRKSTQEDLRIFVLRRSLELRGTIGCNC